MGDKYHPYFGIIATVVCERLGFLLPLFPVVNEEISFGTVAQQIPPVLIATGVAISACVEIIHLQPVETMSPRSDAAQDVDSEPLLSFEDVETEGKIPGEEEISEILILEDATIIEGPQCFRNISGEKITYVSDFVAKLTQNFLGGQNHQIQLLEKGDLVTTSAINKGYWLVGSLEDIPKAGYNAFRKSGQKDYDDVEREAKEVMNWGVVTSLSFMNGYVTIGLGDSMRDEDLEKLPQVLGTWPTRYDLKKVRGRELGFAIAIIFPIDKAATMATEMIVPGTRRSGPRWSPAIEICD
ncbi:hypothetical protein BDZ45DRAFT_755062 [Acephala macrosclerotiorum]|nr:hypothetical protein BDZ45DRAFT_755062 [Acephala macrosclerotiorum]